MSPQEGKRPAYLEGVPPENFSSGILEVELPADFGPRTQGKTADMWIVDGKLVIVRTDINSSYDSLICTIPGSGAVVNSSSVWWFRKIGHMGINHFLGSPHRNVMIAEKMDEMFDVEFVWRSYFERSSTQTSLYHNYVNEGKRNIYGIAFPPGLVVNQELPMGQILTPTTKSKDGHDLIITEEEARGRVDKTGGIGTYDKFKKTTSDIYSSAKTVAWVKGIIVASTKFEGGIKDGQIKLADELLTPHSSRLWIASTYEERFAKGKNPDSLDKELLRRKLAELGFRGEGPIPRITPFVARKIGDAYQKYLMMLRTEREPLEFSTEEEIREAIVNYFSRN